MSKSTQDPAVLTRLIETVHRLRAPGGCPWDREQTHQSIRKYLIEEAYEVLDVIDQVKNPSDLKDESTKAAFREELGDVLMQVLLHAEIANEEGAFDFYEIAKALDEKLIRRHPHVFGEVKADSAASALITCEKQKAKEKLEKKESVLGGIPQGLPALQKAFRVVEKVTRVGFQWSDMKGPLGKLDEELGEFKAEVKALESAHPTDREHARAKLEGELGDLLFSICNVGFLMKLDPEEALRGAVARFISRFKYVEDQLRERGKKPESSTLSEMDELWNEAKAKERAR